MPHDKHGMKIEIGDYVLAKPYNYSKTPVVGVVTTMREGQTCSGDFSWVSAYHGIRNDAFGAGEAEIIVKADGMPPARGDAPVGSGG